MSLEDTVAALTRQLGALTEKKEIEDLITWRFARAIDWLDVAAAKACFHPDGRFLYDAIDLNAHEFCDLFGKGGAALKMRWHFLGAPAVSVQGDTAIGEAYGVYAATFDDKTTGKLKDYVVAVRYLSTIERREKVWRMTRLQVLFDWSIGQDSPEKTSSGNTYNRGLDTASPFFRKI